MHPPVKPQTSYDGLNRPTAKTYTDGTPTVRYCYDGFDYDAVSGACTGSQVIGKKGRLTATGSAVSVTRFTAFDDLGRITASQQSTAGGDYNFIYGYNLSGGLEVQQYPSGRQVETCYDAAGRVNGLTDFGDLSAYASNVSYAPRGALAQLLFGNGLLETTSFNNRLQPFKIQAGGLLTMDFEYNTLGQTDNNGNVLKQKIDAPGLPAILTQTYTYDGVNRLASITETGGSTNWNRAYGYDAYGNRAATGANVFANTPQSLADFDAATNQLTAAWAGYDTAGNLTSFNKPSFEWTAAYDADNLQSSFTSGSTTTTYQYDGDGRRVKKLQGSRTTVFVYDAFGNLAAEYDTQPDPNLVAGTYYRTTDHLGSTRLVTDGNGAVVSRRDFFPFGEEIPANATFGNRQQVTDGNPFTTYNQEFGVYQKFTGKERDGESGLDYFLARYYSNNLGRFTSVDPANADASLDDPRSWNGYSYTRNSPVRFTDPDGRALPVIIVACAANPGCRAAVGGTVSGIVNAAVQLKTTGRIDSGQVLEAGVTGAVATATIGALAPAAGTTVLSVTGASSSTVSLSGALGTAALTATPAATAGVVGGIAGRTLGADGDIDQRLDAATDDPAQIVSDAIVNVATEGAGSLGQLAAGSTRTAGAGRELNRQLAARSGRPTNAKLTSRAAMRQQQAVAQSYAADTAADLISTYLLEPEDEQ